MSLGPGTGKCRVGAEHSGTPICRNDKVVCLISAAKRECCLCHDWPGCLRGAIEGAEREAEECLYGVDSRGSDLYQLLTPFCQLCKVIRTVRSSPQRRQNWLREVQMSCSEESWGAGSTAFMLILDVKTQWSSMYQMLPKWRLV
jgi:hypothetical protein